MRKLSEYEVKYDKPEPKPRPWEPKPTEVLEADQ